MAASGSADSFTYYPPGSASGATADPASGRSEDYEKMTLKALRDLAGKTPGMTKKKKVGTKWTNKNKAELLKEFRAFDAKKSAQPLAGPKTELDNRWSKKARQTCQEDKAKSHTASYSDDEGFHSDDNASELTSGYISGSSGYGGISPCE